MLACLLRPHLFGMDCLRRVCAQLVTYTFIVGSMSCGSDGRPRGGGGSGGGGVETDAGANEPCPEGQVPVPGMGCRDCQPGRPFCDSDEYRICGDDGMSSTIMAQCTGFEICTPTGCNDACAQAAEDRSNVGCEYYAVDLDNVYEDFLGGSHAKVEQFAVVLANPSELRVEATVFRSTGTPNAPSEEEVGTYTIEPNDLVRIDLDHREVDGSAPPNMMDGPGTALTNNAYRLTTNYPVVAYQFNPVIQTHSNDASLLLPTSAMDTKYRVINWPAVNPNGVLLAPDHTYVTVVGTQEGTTVRVTLGGATVAGVIQGGGEIPEANPGDVIEQTLGPYDVLNLESRGAPGDLTGTIVESSAPVAVFSGAERAIAPYSLENVSRHPNHREDPDSGNCCTEHTEEQVFPVTAWGRDFVVTRSPVRSAWDRWREPDIYRVLADQNGTDIVTNLPAPNDHFVLNENEWVELSTDRPFTMNASGPVSLQQMLVTQGWVHQPKSGHGGDPSMLLFPPYQQFKDNYIVLAPETFATNYIVLAAPGGAQVLLDGMDINSSEFGSICDYEQVGTMETTLFNQVTCLVEGGTHWVESSMPVGVMVYGYYGVGSYGFAGGANVKIINPLI